VITTLVPVKVGLTVPDTLAHALADGFPLLASVTLTEYFRLEVRGPVVKTELVAPVTSEPRLQPDPVYH
jgi:hypothetical protein